jgi:hypothetical protein
MKETFSKRQEQAKCNECDERNPYSNKKKSSCGLGSCYVHTLVAKSLNI